jgi:large subunit ribosomal protein L5
MKTFNLSTVMQVPKIEKITLNVGLGMQKKIKKLFKQLLMN